NLDMVGRMTDDSVLYYNASSDLQKTSEDFFQQHKTIKVRESQKDRLAQLDSKWFMERGIPTITLTTGIHTDYHKPTDDFESLNINGMLLTEKFVLNFLQH